MKLLSSLCLLLASLVGVSVQQCTIERFENVIALDTLQAAEATDANQNFMINRTVYNCLSTSQIIGVYNSMSVSILYIRSDTPNQLRDVRYNMQCSNGNWARVGRQSTALVSSDTRRNCSDCTNQTVNNYHCTPCDNSCTGLNQCYGPGADQCCSYNDDGNCVADCGMNREGNSTFHCVCSNFWTGANCDVCSLNCMNGATPQSDCSACQCVPGYEGTLCDVNIDECSPNPCQNGGKCTDLINGYNCTCRPLYSGHNCSEEKPKEEGQEDDGLSAGSIIGIIIACLVAALLLIVLIIVASAVVFHEYKKRLKIKLKFKDPDLFEGGNIQKYSNPVFIHPDVVLSAVEGNGLIKENFNVTVTDRGKDEKNLLQGTLV